LAELAKLSSPSAAVLRDGVRVSVDATEVVPGDIILLETGDLVPADARLIEATDLSVDEASLTGESEPSEKALQEFGTDEIPLGDQKNMVFSSCLVVSGRGKAVVTGTGMSTELGKIAGYLNSSQKVRTPLQQRLDKLGKTISLIAVVAALALLIVGYVQGVDRWEIIFLAVALAVAAVPEMLALIVTLTLANGVKKMVAKNALIRKLPAVETLGSVSVICSDKTGTLTQNLMSIRRLWTLGGTVTTHDAGFTADEATFIEQLALASNATSRPSEETGEIEYIGNPTETAIIRLLAEKGVDQKAVEARFPRVAEVAFSSERKMMTTVHQDPAGGFLVLTKGALDRLPLRHDDAARMGEIMDIHDEFAGDALRVLGLGRRHVDTLPEDLTALETDLEFVGIIGVIDPPRPEAKAAIERARHAGIRTVMITGDHAATAKAIAVELGIMHDGDRVVTGLELSHMSDAELVDTVQDISVYARVSPEDKIRIVEAWQEHDEVVAMTGDGVNDAPALNAADVGIAMGITGTEVSKGAADMILVDDNFATLVDAVQEGRNVFAIIKKLIYFLITCNFAEVIIILGAFLFGWGPIVTPVLILLINVVADGIPGLRLPQEVADPEIMKRKPIDRNESFFGGGLLYVIMKQVIAFTVVVWVAYYLGANHAISSTITPTHQVGQTTAFVTLGFVAVLHLFTARTPGSIFKANYRANWLLPVAAFAMMALLALFVLLPPFRFLFELVQIGGGHWLLIAGLCVIPSIVAEIGKAVRRRAERAEYRRRLLRHTPHDIYELGHR
jgi:calcium-translocating P-type ATPase